MNNFRYLGFAIYKSKKNFKFSLMTFAYRKQILFAIIFGVLVYLGYKEDNTSVLIFA